MLATQSARHKVTFRCCVIGIRRGNVNFEDHSSTPWLSMTLSESIVVTSASADEDVRRSKFARGQRLALIALCATFGSALALGANRPVSWTALMLFVAALLAVRTLDDLRHPMPRLVVREAYVPALLWFGVLAWGLIQTIPLTSGLIPASWVHPTWDAVSVADGVRSISADPSAGATLAARLAGYAGLFWIAARAALDERNAAMFIGVVAVFSSALAVYGLAAATSGENPILGLSGGPTVVSASFVNRNSYATFAAFGVLANLAMTLRAARRVDGLRDGLEIFFAGAWVFVLGVMICATALAATQSRAGIASAGAGIAVMLLAWVRSSAARAGTAAFALTSFGFVAAIAGSGVARRILTTGAEDARFLVFPYVLEGATDRLWLGHGLGAFHDVFRAYVPFEAAVGEWDKAHNSYLENLFELGLLASIALYLALGLLCARIVSGAHRRRRHRVYACLGFGVATTAALHSAFDFSLQMPATAALFAILLGTAWAQSFRSQDFAQSD